MQSSTGKESLPKFVNIGSGDALRALGVAADAPQPSTPINRLESTVICLICLLNALDYTHPQLDWTHGPCLCSFIYNTTRCLFHVPGNASASFVRIERSRLAGDARCGRSQHWRIEIRQRRGGKLKILAKDRQTDIH